MNKTLSGPELVAQWRNSAEFDNPAGPLFSGQFAEVDITNDCGGECTRVRTGCDPHGTAVITCARL